MHMQIITFRLTEMDDAAFCALCDELAPIWATIPGLISKVWLADSATGTYGGIYAWESRAACEAFLQSDYFHAIATHPNFCDATSHEFGVLDAPTRLTRGLGGAVA